MFFGDCYIVLTFLLGVLCRRRGTKNGTERPTIVTRSSAVTKARSIDQARLNIDLAVADSNPLAR
jgi:hypothetical protein